MIILKISVRREKVIMKNYVQNMQEYLNKEIRIIKQLDLEEINEAVNALDEACQRNANVYIMGNGGSAATASHFVCDFNKGVWETRSGNRFHIHCLSDNTPIMTAIANDIGYEDVFEYQLKEVLGKKDLVIAISGSGNSKNIVKAIQYAKEVGCKIIGITGYNGGEVRKLSDFCMHVPIDDMQIAEDIHMIFDHMVMRILCK